MRKYISIVERGSIFSCIQDESCVVESVWWYTVLQIIEW